MKRSVFFKQIAAGAIGATVIRQQAAASAPNPENTSNLFYIGCYTAAPEEGIPVCRLDPKEGSINQSGICKGVENPSFLVMNQSRTLVYSVNETADFEGKASGAVSAFLRDSSTGRLTYLNSRPSLGADPCHLSIDRSGKFILVANYSGGNASVLPLLDDGRIGEPIEMVQHSGKGVNAARQGAPHAHSVNLSPDNRFAMVCDLGLDKIMIYSFDDKTGKLTPAKTPFFQTEPGAGPRHFTFTRDGKHAIVVNELNSTITLLAYDAMHGILTSLQSQSNIPDGFIGENSCADVHIHPNGRFVYASNRGHDSIAVYALDPSMTHLSPIQYQPTLGKTPRNFAIHPSGKFLLAANQNSGSVQVFSLDPGTGKLKETGKHLKINKPVCILF